MPGIVIQLQQDALDPKVRVADLLRKALVVSRKLSHHEFQSWVESELNGYQGEESVPNYREVRGQVRGFNPYTGAWMPLIFEDHKTGEMFSKRKSRQPVAELEHLVERTTGNSFHMPFPESIQRELSKGFEFETQVSLMTDKASLIGTLDAIRTVVLNWSLKLEEDGILGESFTFTDKEREVASKVPQNVNNFYAPVHGQNLQQGNQVATQTQILNDFDPSRIAAFIAQLRQELPAVNLGESLRAELEAEIATIDSQLKSPKPKSGIIREGLTSIRTILEGAAGSTAGQLLIELGKTLFS